ncbi:MAG: hypothetical protein OJF50_004786 [Nitrospira sp.]|nr:hypothetical protein [Nitrospira sp.]
MFRSVFLTTIHPSFNGLYNKEVSMKEVSMLIVRRDSSTDAISVTTWH